MYTLYNFCNFILKQDRLALANNFGLKCTFCLPFSQLKAIKEDLSEDQNRNVYWNSQPVITIYTL